MKSSKNNGAQRKISTGQSAEKRHRLSSKRLSSIFNVNDMPTFKRNLIRIFYIDHIKYNVLNMSMYNIQCT